jgi:DNA mismatch repair protein MutH
LELMRRAEALAGRRLGDVAAELKIAVPAHAVRAKGWTGTLLEATLGATAASLPEPDFQNIGVELKTVPLRPDGRPRESTYICTLSPPGGDPPLWENSNVRRKLARVLFVPVVYDTGVGLADRIVAAPMIWSPSREEESALRADWEELMDLACTGRLESITARHGAHLQIRPKAANAAARQRGVGEDGAPADTLPRGFYLRASFTAAIFKRHYARIS